MGFGIGEVVCKVDEYFKGTSHTMIAGFRVAASVLGILVFILVTTGSSSAQSYLSIIDIHSNLFDQEAVQHNAEHFVFSSEGKITDGPRRFDGEGIDISSLVSVADVAQQFTKSIFACVEGVRHCHREEMRLPTGPIKLVFTYAPKDEFSEYAAKLREKVLPAAEFLGIEFREKDQERAEIEFMIVNERDLIDAANSINDPYAATFFGWDGEQNEITKEFSEVFGPCYTSTKDRAKGTVTILLTPSGIDECSMRSFLVALGLNETGGLFPSATGLDREYNFPTLADRAFFSILYSPEFPIGGRVDIVESYSRAYLESHSSLLLRSN